jgi:hypothetical protein
MRMGGPFPSWARKVARDSTADKTALWGIGLDARALMAKEGRALAQM